MQQILLLSHLQICQFQIHTFSSLHFWDFRSFFTGYYNLEWCHCILVIYWMRNFVNARNHTSPIPYYMAQFPELHDEQMMNFPVYGRFHIRKIQKVPAQYRYSSWNMGHCCAHIIIYFYSVGRFVRYSNFIMSGYFEYPYSKISWRIKADLNSLTRLVRLWYILVVTGYQI